MLFNELNLKGAYLIELNALQDERGSFTRLFCKDHFRKQALSFEIIQTNLSYNKKKGTLRGMHYQIKPHEEIKLVQCVRGAIFDVIIDIRPNSPTYRRWIGVELSQDKYQILYVPTGFAHGFQTLTDDAEVLYQMSTAFSPTHARGIHWNDPCIGIDWPDCPQRIISEKDQRLPLLSDASKELNVI